MSNEPEAGGKPVGTPNWGDKRNRGSKKGKRRLPPYLRDLRAVYAQEEAKDSSPAQKALRLVFKEDIQKYMGMLQAAERAHEMGRRGAMERAALSSSEPVKAVVDVGTEKQLALVDKLLAEFESMHPEK